MIKISNDVLKSKMIFREKIFPRNISLTYYLSSGQTKVALKLKYQNIKKHKKKRKEKKRIPKQALY